MILLNALQGVSACVTMPKAGAWFADVDLDLDVVPVMPTGPAILTLDTTILRGTIDDRHSGKIGSKAKVRLVAGGGGWDTPVPALHIHNDAGVLSTAVYAVTAASVGESPVVELGAPKLFGVDYVRTQGPASRVFAGVEWWVDILGITHTGPRPPLPPPLPTDILNWHPTSKVAEIASDVFVLPGMVLVDPRFGVATVEDVEHTFDGSGAKAIAWCSTPSLTGAATSVLASPPPSSGTKLVRALGALARESAGSATLKQYPYRVVVQAPDGRVNLQSTILGGEAPAFLVLIDIWAGLPGMSCKLTPASVVLVSFVNGDPGRPVIVAFDPDNPPAIEVKLDGIRIALGTIAIDPVAKSTATVVALNALQAQFAGLAVWVAANTATTWSAVGLTATAPALAAVLATGTVAVPAATTLIPSPKTFTD